MCIIGIWDTFVFWGRHMIKKIFLLLLCFFIASCNIKASAPIKVSELLSEENSVIIATLKVRLDSQAGEHESQIKQIEQTLKSKGLKAHYLSKTEQENSYTLALFSVPIEIVKTGNTQKLENKIYLMFENNELSIRTSKDFAALLNYKESDKEYNVRLNSFELLLTNDLDVDMYLKAYSVFVDSKAVLLDHFTLSPFATVNVSLSDVANKIVTSSSARYTIFLLNDTIEALSRQNVRNLMSR